MLLFGNFIKDATGTITLNQMTRWSTGESSFLQMSECGDGITSEGSWEECDDGNNNNNDGCSFACTVESGWNCEEDVNGLSHCSICGNAMKTSDEQCDDGNLINNDGCSSSCLVETFYSCYEDNNGKSHCSLPRSVGSSCNSFEDCDSGFCNSVNNKCIGKSATYEFCTQSSVQLSFDVHPRFSL